MSSIVHLAPELVLRVLDFVEPPTLVPVASSCRFLESCLRDLLQKHRDAHSQYRVVTDVAPRSVPKLLQETIVDPSLAWHVRELEITSARTTWSHWTKFEPEEVDGSTMAALGLRPDYTFTHNAQVDFLDQLRETFHFDEHKIDQAREDLQRGNDAPLKLLLIGICPRLKSLKFTRNFRPLWPGDLERASSDSLHHESWSSLEYLYQAVHIQRQNGNSAWPLGLNSLQHLAIGMNPGNAIENSEFALSPRLVTGLMHLPTLVSLYLSGLDFSDGGNDNLDDANVRYNTDKGSSSVQQIFLHGAHGGNWGPRDAIISGCKRLKSLTVSSSELDDIDALVQTAGRYHAESLETLMFYDTDRLNGYRCNMFRPEELHGFANLRMIYINASDVMLDAFYNYKGDIQCGPEHEHVGDLDHFIEFFMNSSFPASTEVLVLGIGSSSGLLEADADFLDQAIAKMIKYGRSDDQNHEEHNCDAMSDISTNSFETCFSSLKAIFLGSLDETYYTGRQMTSRPQPRGKRWFSNAIAAGRKFGVDVHTRTTRSLPFHQIDFPKPPTMLLPWGVNIPSDRALAFDIYTGRWGSSRCENCGTCNECLAQYQASVWKEVENEIV